jgi:hypothetical protein
MTTRQRYVVWAWIGLIVASCVCPPWHQGNSSRGYALIFAPPHAAVDLPRLVLEWVAVSAVLAGLYFVRPAAARAPRLNLPRIHLSRRAMIALIPAVVAVACVCGAWGLSRISRQLPTEELARLDGLCMSSSGTFSGEIHNGSHAWTIREVTIRLTLKEAPPGTVPNATIAPPLEAKSRDYQIRNLSIGPLETGHVLVEVLTPPGSEFVQWRPIDAKGFTSLWYGIEQTLGASPVPSAMAEPAAPTTPTPKPVTFRLSDIDAAPSARSLPPAPLTRPTAAPPPAGGEWHVVSSRPAAPPTAPRPTLDFSDLGKYGAALGNSATPPSAATKVYEAVPVDTCANPDPDEVESRPPNGSSDKAGGGYGTLKITNGNTEDAAVILASTIMQPEDRFVYIRAGMSATMAGIPTGQYRMMFQIGRNWDGQGEAFRCVSATGAFDRLASFEEQEKLDAIEYTAISITLHKLVGGNARTTAMPQNQFHRRAGRGVAARTGR